MPGRRKITMRQIDLLLKFAEANEDIGLGRFPCVSLSAKEIRQAWEAIAFKLNAVPHGCSKTSEQWRRYWIEFKAKAKAKAASLRKKSLLTGEGSNSTPLFPHEKRVLALVRPTTEQDFPVVPDRKPRFQGNSELSPSISSSSIPSPSAPVASPDLSSTYSFVEIPKIRKALPKAARAQKKIAVQHSTLDSPSSAPTAYHRLSKLRPRLPIHRDKSVPRWVYNMQFNNSTQEHLAESVAAVAASQERLADSVAAVAKSQERLATSMEKIATTMAAIQNLLTTQEP